MKQFPWVHGLGVASRRQQGETLSVCRWHSHLQRASVAGAHRGVPGPASTSSSRHLAHFESNSAEHSGFAAMPRAAAWRPWLQQPPCRVSPSNPVRQMGGVQRRAPSLPQRVDTARKRQTQRLDSHSLASKSDRTLRRHVDCRPSLASHPTHAHCNGLRTQPSQSKSQTLLSRC